MFRYARGEPSDHRHAAVHVQGLAGDIGSLVAGQIDAGRGDFRARPQARRPGSSTGSRLLLLVQHVGHRAVDEARRHAVHGDVAAWRPPGPAPWTSRSCRPWRRRSWPGRDCR